MSPKIGFFVLLLCVSGGLSQITGNGVCQNLFFNPVPNLNFNQFSGRWNVIERTADTYERGDCSTVDYTPTAATSFGLVSKHIYDRNPYYRNGTLTRPANISNGTLYVNYNTNVHPSPAYYLVLATDYNNYALVCTCYTDSVRYQLYSWKLSRTTSLSNTYNTAINNALQSYPVLSQSAWTTSSHSANACRENSSHVFYSSAALVLFMTVLGLGFGKN